MSERFSSLRRRSRSSSSRRSATFPSNHQKTTRSVSKQTSPSTRFPTPAPHRSKPPRRPTKVLLQRCKSEPILCTVSPFFQNEHQNPEPCTVLYRPQTCTDIFVSPFGSESPPSPSIYERYNENAKVVVSVTVEGSPGPVRAMVRLGASVEETIKMVVNKYSKEGRTPHILGQDGASAFELHHSHFSLESISKEDKIGEVGSRSFYLRRSESSRSCSSISKEDGKAGLLVASAGEGGGSGGVAASPLIVFLSAFFARKLSKIGRRTRKLWRVMGCLTCE